jgi:IclR family transcriptional regulator, acetate operon repressor
VPFSDVVPETVEVAPSRATGTSTTRALRVVEAVAAAGDGVTAKAIARRLGIPLPSVYRAVGTLVREGYLVRLNEVRGYGLGYRVAQLHRCLTEQVRPSAPVRAVLHDVHTTLGAPAYLAVLRDVDIVMAYVDDCAAHPRPGLMRVGEPVAPRHTAAGKAVLADLRPGVLAELAARHGAAGQVMPIVDDPELRRIRSDGAAVEMNEYGPGTGGVAAPVHQAGGDVSGALGVSMRYAELAARLPELERAVREAAAHVAALGADLR